MQAAILDPAVVAPLPPSLILAIV
ncbi:hypothetical protein HYPGJ_40103 [Hyphomicrobium sp. GJ21]|nr:hypothetical protein HYPGJ_40103 [Hyphomicrobium sp. GJ21]